MIEDFCVFILTHGRPDNVKTYATLQKCGYTGPVYIVIDNEDKSGDRYRQNFGDRVIVFDKKDEATRTDRADNFDGLGTVLFARNACFDIASRLGFRYFLELDDDYSSFGYRYISDGRILERGTLDMTRLFSSVLDFYKSVDAKSVALMQNGDLLGGVNNGIMFALGPRRKVMNSFFCSVDRPFRFVGRMNDDVNTYVSIGMRGGLFLTMSQASLGQSTTQTNAGGLTEMYLAYGTYVKSFYTVMVAPSCVTVSVMGETHRRLHHRISWKHAVPQIIEEKYRRV